MKESDNTNSVFESDPTVLDEHAQEPIPKSKGRKKWPIVVSVVAVVAIAAGAGFWVWHEQPSFCNVICHSPMDHYVESYYSNDASLLVTAHVNEGDTCLDCHVPTIEEQITEGITWIQGDFKDPLPPMEYKDAFCLNEKCHNVTREDLSKTTENLAWNPHDNRHGIVDCSVCHQVHEESTYYCAGCHSEAAEMADEIGWSYEVLQ